MIDNEKCMYVKVRPDGLSIHHWNITPASQLSNVDNIDEYIMLTPMYSMYFHNLQITDNINE